jgi:hypothetical protein
MASGAVLRLRAGAGQATAEYLLGLALVVLVLFVPLFDGRSVVGALANALHDQWATLGFLVSLQ